MAQPLKTTPYNHQNSIDPNVPASSFDHIAGNFAVTAISTNPKTPSVCKRGKEMLPDKHCASTGNEPVNEAAVGVNQTVKNNTIMKVEDEDEEEEEEIITQSSPPTEIVDTVVTMTTNPDGSLKRTTRKTTRTLLTTTRVRRVKVKTPVTDESKPDGNPEATGTSAVVVKPTLYTLIGQSTSCQGDHGNDSITQAAFTFLPPTSHTEVSYLESDDSEVKKELDSTDTLKQDNTASNVKTRTKTTVKKTITTSAATATFVATGLSKQQKGSKTVERSFNAVAKMPDSSNIQTENVSATDDDGTVTMTKRTTRVVNNLASKSLLFTRSSLDTLRRSILGKELREKAPSSSCASGSSNLTVEKTFDSEETDQFALLAMSESERRFSEAKLLSPQGEASQVSQDERIIACPSSEACFDDKKFHSIFSNLPLYQGYGLLAHQLALSSQLSQQTETNASGTSTKIQEPTEQTEYSSLPTTWFAVGCPLSGQGIEVTQTTDALVNLLDESTERMLKEAAKYWCGVQCTSFDISNAGIDESVKGGIEAMSFQRPLAEYEGLTEGMENLEKYPPAARFTHTVKPPATEIAKFPDATSEQPNARLPQNGQSPSETEISNEREQPRLGYLGLSSPGAFRVAWSEMPEVLNSDALKLLTKHEIQLQEAMFEVITSEASYYQSLNVLVKHFYHAPEFSYGRNGSNTATSRNDSTMGFVQQSTHVNQGHTMETTGLISPIPNSGETVIDNTPAELGGTSFGPSTTAGKRPILKPLEKHHLFSNVLLVCLASEKFLQDLEKRWISQMPILSEVCDLIVKHAGGVTFEPYVTYLRNQAYQMATLRKLCQRESFRDALDALHSNPISGKHSINSFLALPMQRLTRLKLLVEVIRRLQDTIVEDAAKADFTKRPVRVPTDRQRENVQLALGELCRLLTCSETEKELMDQKTRLLTLSNSLEFPDNVKCIAISDKRLIKEGELREVALDGRMSVLQKLSLRKPNSYYIILFNDMLLVTKRKRNDRYVVLDYCERAAIQADVQHLSDLQNRSLNPQSCNLPQPLSTCPLDSPFGLPNTDPPANSTAVRFSEHRQTTELTGVGEEHEDLYSHQNHTDKRILSRSGSSLSGYRIRTRIKSNIGFNVHQTTSSDQANTKIIHLILTASHNGTFTELNLLPKDSHVFKSWCKAFTISTERVDGSFSQSDNKPCLTNQSLSKSDSDKNDAMMQRSVTVHNIQKHDASSPSHKTNSVATIKVKQ